MDHPVLVPSNNQYGSQRNPNYTCTKQPPATPISQELDLSSSINTVEIVSSNDILQAALRPSTILKHKTY